MPTPRILLVDDEKSIRLTLGANLELADFEVIEADCAAQALQLLGRHRFDLVLSDVLMPGMTGVNLFRHIKQGHPELPVILMTAYALDDLVNAAIREGVFTVLPKPFDLERVVELLMRASRHPGVLVLDETPEAQASAALALQAAGVRVQVATTMDRAYGLIRAGEVDVGVVNLSVRPEEVQDMVQKLLHVAPGLALLLISGQIPAEIMARLARLGVRSFIGRPFKSAQLVEMVAKLRAQAVVA